LHQRVGHRDYPKLPIRNCTAYQTQQHYLLQAVINKTMKKSHFIHCLREPGPIQFILPDGQRVAPHFHITEVGLTTRHFVDCGGTVREEQHLSLQLWVADDTEHRLAPLKLLSIIQTALPLIEPKGLDVEVEVEYQNQSISRYGLAFDGTAFHLIAKQTGCLAEDQCGFTPQKHIRPLSEITPINEAICSPGTGCCS
jgi:hypothetical protein